MSFQCFHPPLRSAFKFARSLASYIITSKALKFTPKTLGLLTNIEP